MVDDDNQHIPTLTGELAEFFRRVSKRLELERAISEESYINRGLLQGEANHKEALISKIKLYVLDHEHLTEIQRQLLQELLQILNEEVILVPSVVSVVDGDENAVAFSIRPNKDSVGHNYMQIDPDGDIIMGFIANTFGEGHTEVNTKEQLKESFLNFLS